MVKTVEDNADDYVLDVVSGGGGDVRNHPAFDLGLKIGTVNVVAVKRLYTNGNEDQGTWTDHTKEARSKTGSAFTAFRLVTQQYDALYICFRKKPKLPVGIRIDIDTAGAGSPTMVWEYVDAVDSELFPSSWKDLAEVDGTTGLEAGTSIYSVKWIVPSDFVKAKIDGIEGYWIKLMCSSGAYTTAPKIEWIGGVLPQPASSITVKADIDGDCNIHLNSRLIAGSIVDNTAIPVKTGTGIVNRDFDIYNYVIKSFGAGKTANVYSEAKVGGHDGSQLG